jgi:hypothetical protein
VTAERLEGSIKVPSDVLVQRLPDDESVFLNLATEQYFGLDPTGTAMWVALTETGSVAGALERLVAEFDADRAVLSRDLAALVERLVSRGLIEVAAGPTALPEAGGG